MPRAMTRVYLPDGRYKTIVVESDQTVRDLIPIVTEKFQATSTESFSNYVLFESLDNEKVINELSLSTKPYDITTQWKPESNNRLIFKRTNQTVLVHDTGFVPPPSTTVLPDAPKNNPPPYSSAPQGGQPPIPARKLPVGAQPLFTPGATSNASTMRKRAPSDAQTQSYQPINTPTGNAAELQERLNKMRMAEQERKTQDVVQKQSILVWCNYHLRGSGVEVSDIVPDFADGVNFALLIQELTKTPIKINQSPRTYQEKMENLRGSFAVLESIGAKPKGCAPEDFVNGNVNAITGLLLLLVGRFKDVSKRASSRFSTILTSQGAAVSSAPSRPPPQRPPRAPGQGTLSRPIPSASPAQPEVSTSPPARPQPSQPPARPTPAPKTTTAPPPSQPIPSRTPATQSTAPQQPPPAQPSRPSRPAVPPRSSLDPEATGASTKQSSAPQFPPKATTMRDRSTSAADVTPAPTPAPKTTAAPPAQSKQTPTKQASAPPAQGTGKSPFTQALPDRSRSASSADTTSAPAPAPVKRPAPAPAKPKQTTEPQPPPPQPTPPLVTPKQRPEEDEFALGELDDMMDTISSFVAPKQPEPTPSKTSTTTTTSMSKYPTLEDDDLGEITLLSESLSEITTAAPSGNLPIRKLSSATLPTTTPTTTTPSKATLAPTPASAEEEPHFEDFDELEDFLADLANELGVQLGEMESKPKSNNNDLSSLDLNFDI